VWRKWGRSVRSSLYGLRRISGEGSPHRHVFRCAFAREQSVAAAESGARGPWNSRARPAGRHTLAHPFRGRRRGMRKGPQVCSVIPVYTGIPSRPEDSARGPGTRDLEVMIRLVRMVAGPYLTVIGHCEKDSRATRMITWMRSPRGVSPHRRRRWWMPVPSWGRPGCPAGTAPPRLPPGACRGDAGIGARVRGKARRLCAIFWFLPGRFRAVRVLLNGLTVARVAAPEVGRQVGGAALV
jgi:hypothetical protein